VKALNILLPVMSMSIFVFGQNSAFKWHFKIVCDISRLNTAYCKRCCPL